MAEPQLPKLMARVRFPSFAPEKLRTWLDVRSFCLCRVKFSCQSFHEAVIRVAKARTCRRCCCKLSGRRQATVYPGYPHTQARRLRSDSHTNKDYFAIQIVQPAFVNIQQILLGAIDIESLAVLAVIAQYIVAYREYYAAVARNIQLAEI